MRRLHDHPRIAPEAYEPHPGDLWRKDGPIGMVRVKRVLLPGHNAYDMGLPGLSVRVLQKPIEEPRAWRERFFPAASAGAFARRMHRSGRYLHHQPSPPSLLNSIQNQTDD